MGEKVKKKPVGKAPVKPCRRIQMWRKRVAAKQKFGLRSPVTDSEKETMTVCKNCGNTFQGQYCPHCGQSANVRRLTIRDVLHNMFTAIVGADSTFLRTCVDLLYRPGYMIREFLVGARARYFKPVQMLLCLVTVYAVVSHVSGIDLFSWDMDFEDADRPEMLTRATQMLSNFLSNKVVVSLVSAFLSVFPYKLMFRKCTIPQKDSPALKLNVAEHFCVLVYLSCQNLLLNFLIFPLRLSSALIPVCDKLDIILTLLFAVMTYCQLYGMSIWKSTVRNVAAMSLSLLLIVILLILYMGLFYGISTMMM